MKNLVNNDQKSSAAHGAGDALRPVKAQGQKPQGKFKAVSGASVGVPAAAKVLTVSKPRGLSASFAVPPGVRAQHATEVAGILFCQPLKATDRSIQYRSDQLDSVHFSPESAKTLVDSSPVLDTLKIMLEPDPADKSAKPRALWRFQPRNSRQGETQEQRVITAAAQSYADHKPLASIDKIAGNENVYRHFSSAMLRIADRPPIQKLPPADPYHGRTRELTFGGRMARTWVQSLTGGNIRNGELPEVWANCLRAADPNDRRNFLVTIVLDQDRNPLYQFISASGGSKSSDRTDIDRGQISFKMRGPSHPLAQPVELSARKLLGHNDGKCRIQQAIDAKSNILQRGFTYIGYDDLSVRSPVDRVNREVRVLPRTLPVSSHKPTEVHDRARDTEYIVMSALSIIFQAGKLPQGTRPQIYMFSTNEMCSACEGASSIALTRPEFEPVTDFVIYAPRRF